MSFTLDIKTAEQIAADRNAERRSAVTVERDRRLAAGVIVTVSGYGDVPLQGRASDQINLIALADTARDMAQAGVSGLAIPFRDADNTMHTLTPSQMIELASKGKYMASLIYAAAWELKDGGDIPEDFADDKHWPG